MLDPKIIIYLTAGLGACLFSLIITPLVRAVSMKFGFVDRPDGRRKTHKAPVALGGGAAVFLSITAAALLVIAVATALGISLFKPDNQLPLLCLAIGAAGIVGLGLLDDVCELRGRQKLLGQAAVVGLLIYSGVKIEGFSAFGYDVQLLWFTIPASAFWLLGTTNAINLIDGIDGLAGSVGLILSLTMAAITGWQGHTAETALMMALAGAQLGFLRYNFAPATIYLGDAGSMLIGLLCGTVAVLSSAKSPAAMAFAVPIALWSIPIIDSFAALLRRKLTGRSLFAADRGHLHHSLLVRGWTVQQAAFFIALICATTCLSAVLSIYMQNELIALLTVIAVMLFLVFTRTFGHIEFALLKGRMRHLALSVVRSDAVTAKSLRESCLQLQGSREWGKLWSAIVEAADSYRLVKIKLTIDIPSLHESFYASWETSRDDRGESNELWKLSHPLVVDGDQVGQMELTGASERAKKESTLGQFVQLLEFIEPIEEDIRHICEHIETDQPVSQAAEPISEGLSGPRTPELIDQSGEVSIVTSAPGSRV